MYVTNYIKLLSGCIANKTQSILKLNEGKRVSWGLWS